NFGDYFNWLNSNFDRTFFGAWHKTNPIPQVRKVSFLSSLELFVCSWNVSHKWNFSNQNDMHNLIEYPICMGDERTEHSAQKPLEVMAYIIKIATNENDIVLDPFMGSGTTAIASRLCNRHFIGFEIDNKYYNISLKRVMNIPIRIEEFKT
ncbi:MAG: DNA-methyltransferase, partial [Candidatus Hodarchaeota archaeon]